jgi:dTDP-4-dehydrorhamnose 3,5-epimerase
LQLIPTPLNDVVILEPKVFGDERGFFLESYNEATFRCLGLPPHFMQDNHSGSRKGVLRGLHYQLHQPQGKLIRVLRGEIFDVAVDLRQSSPQFGQWFGLTLSAENKRQLWIPPGFAHGFLVLSDFGEVAYKATQLYAPAQERCILWNDPALGIVWPLNALAAEPTLSSPTLYTKDQAGSLLADAETYPASAGL